MQNLQKHPIWYALQPACSSDGRHGSDSVSSWTFSVWSLLSFLFHHSTIEHRLPISIHSNLKQICKATATVLTDYDYSTTTVRLGSDLLFSRRLPLFFASLFSVVVSCGRLRRATAAD